MGVSREQENGIAIEGWKQRASAFAPPFADPTITEYLSHSRVRKLLFRDREVKGNAQDDGRPASAKRASPQQSARDVFKNQSRRHGEGKAPEHDGIEAVQTTGDRAAFQMVCRACGRPASWTFQRTVSKRGPSLFGAATWFLWRSQFSHRFSLKRFVAFW